MTRVKRSLVQILIHKPTIIERGLEPSTFSIAYILHHTLMHLRMIFLISTLHWVKV